jgi:histone deacetylase 1/2
MIDMFIERLWDKRVVPENEFEESEDEETNALHGVRYAKSLRHGRASKANNQEQPPRTRGTVDSLPAAATKLSHPTAASGASGASSNGQPRQNGTAANGATKAGSAEDLETDGDVVMDSGSASATVPSGAATAKDTEMTEAP